MTIIFTGGGTGGHIFPILAIWREMKKIYPQEDLRAFYLGPKDIEIQKVLLQEGIKTKRIISGKLRRYFSFKNILDIFKIPLGVLQSFFWLFFLFPDLVFSKGGYGSFPAALVAKILAIPLVLHESDVSPGLASKIESKWAQEIFTSFSKTEFFPPDKIILVGNPIRKEILGGQKEKAQKIFNLKREKPLILILGGSQGSQRVNELILEILPQLLENFELIHQTGPKNFKEVKAESEVLIEQESLKKYYHPFPFLKEDLLREALNASDLIVSRAGSGSIFEIAAAGKPAILIPLPEAAQNHQLKNAYLFSGEGGAEVIEEKNLRPHFFLEKLKFLFSRPDILAKMRKNSLNFARPKAAKIIASYLVEYLKILSKK